MEVVITEHRPGEAAMAMLTTVFPLLGAPSGSRELLFGSMPNPTGMPMCSPAMYMDAIRMAVKAEPYEMCPAESMYWSAPLLPARTHHSPPTIPIS